MNYLKLFEDFEEKSFMEIDYKYYLDVRDNFWEIDEYPNLLKKISERLVEVFGHDDFYIDTYSDFDIYIYERVNTLGYYCIYLAEDEWLYLKYIIYENNKELYSYYKCDDIKGLLEAIKFTTSKKGDLVSTIEDNNSFFNGFKFKIAEFPYKLVLKEVFSQYDMNKITFKESSNNFWIFETTVKRKKITINMCYTWETNRFSCVFMKKYSRYSIEQNIITTCLGLKGLKLYIKNIITQ